MTDIFKSPQTGSEYVIYRRLEVPETHISYRHLKGGGIRIRIQSAEPRILEKIVEIFPRWGSVKSGDHVSYVVFGEECLEPSLEIVEMELRTAVYRASVDAIKPQACGEEDGGGEKVEEYHEQKEEEEDEDKEEGVVVEKASGPVTFTSPQTGSDYQVFATFYNSHGAAVVLCFRYIDDGLTRVRVQCEGAFDILSAVVDALKPCGFSDIKSNDHTSCVIRAADIEEGLLTFANAIAAVVVRMQ